MILRDANHLEALNNYGVLLMRHQSYHNAAVFFEKTIDLDPRLGFRFLLFIFFSFEKTIDLEPRLGFRFRG